jgi:hypothetical protein
MGFMSFVWNFVLKLLSLHNFTPMDMQLQQVFGLEGGLQLSQNHTMLPKHLTLLMKLDPIGHVLCTFGWIPMVTPGSSTLHVVSPDS